MKENNNIQVIINTEEQKKKYSDVPALVKKAEITIKSQAELDLATEILKEIKSRYKELETQRKEITAPLDKAKKAVMDLFRTPLENLEKAEKKLKAGITAYTAEMERKAREEQLRLQKLAEEEAEKERKKLEAKIKRAEESGKVDKVEELQAQKEAIAPIEVPVITPQVEKPKGIAFREVWSAEVVDINQLPREYLIPDMQKLNKVAQATKGTISIPGVKFIMQKVVVSTR